MTNNKLPLITDYESMQSLPVNSRVRLSEEFKDGFPNANFYEEFVIVGYAEENYVEPVRKNVIASYTANGLGYLIEQLPGGFRHVFVESGEEDLFGPLVATKHAALVTARTDWHETGTAGDDWDEWSRRLARDVASNERHFKSLLSVLATDSATTLFAEEERERLARALVAALD